LQLFLLGIIKHKNCGLVVQICKEPMIAGTMAGGNLQLALYVGWPGQTYNGW
jgi:hypothetical protein